MNAMENGSTNNDLVTRVTELEEKLVALQAERASAAEQRPVHQSASLEKGFGRKRESRRRLLGKGLGVAAASLGAAALLEVSTGTALADGTENPTIFVNNGANTPPVFGYSSSAADALVGISTGGPGVVGSSNSASSFGVLGIGTGTSGNGGAGVAGFASNSSPELQPVGVYASGQNGYGVYATAQGGNGIGTGTGVYGVGSTINGIGVFGTGTIGVEGSTTTSGGVAVRGLVLSPATLAGYFGGDVQVTGTLTAGTKDFKIDHPQDPANKYLTHSCVESPDQKNVYDGVVTLDGQGEAVVTLPGYFGVLNKDFRYQLTAIGAAGPNLYIKTKISNNTFTIAGGTAGMEVSWLVTGSRHDAFALANPVVVEQDKPANERGRYLHPTLYGHPASDSVVTLPNVAKPPVAPYPIPKIPIPPHK